MISKANTPKKVTVVEPFMYSAWPLIALVKGNLVCIYTVADQHSPTVSGLFFKTSKDGVSWSDAVEIFKDKKDIKGITGVGYDLDGNLLLWYRNGLPGSSSATHELFRFNGDGIDLLSAPGFSLRGGHIGNIVTIKDKGMFAFYNSYGDFRSWGIIKSTDNGLNWQQIPIEENIPKTECPAEIECAFVEKDKFLVLGRKDVEEGTIAMFQFQSSDGGETWTKEYTNITDSYSGSPNVIFDNKTGKIFLYYFARKTGELKRRVVNFKDVWNSPQNWNDPEILAYETVSGYDTGNVKTVAFKDKHFCTYYAGNPTTTGVYGVIADFK